MPFSYHSHSGEFCLHAKDKLEDIVVTAIQKRIRILALTEHMPRDQPEDLYPEEVVLISLPYVVLNDAEFSLFLFETTPATIPISILYCELGSILTLML